MCGPSNLKESCRHCLRLIQTLFENNDNHLADFRERERDAYEAANAASEEQKAEVWRSFVELLREALEACLRENLWARGRGLTTKESSLNDSPLHDTTEA